MEQSQRLPYPEYKEDWDFYVANVDGKTGSIFLDLGLKTVAPLKDKPNVLWIAVLLNKPGPNGMQTDDEFSILKEVEDALSPTLEEKLDALFVGRLTSDGMRQLYYYLSDTTLLDKYISDVMAAFPQYRYDYGTQEDANWSGYLDFLYPTPEQRRCMLNHRVLERLEEGGDKLIKERLVNHWIYFPTENDRAAFIQAIDRQGFKIETMGHSSANEAYPYELEISRVDKVDYQSVDEYVLYLWKLAQDHNGEYDGWETVLERED